MKNLTPAKMILMVVLAFAGMIGLFVVKRLMAVEPPPKKALTRNVPLAMGDIAPGTKITKEHVGLGPWPAENVKGDMILSATAMIGRVAKDHIRAANPFHGKALYAFGELPPLKVSDKYQAVTIKSTDNSHILNGLIKVGDFVDVKFTLKEMQNDPRVQKLGGITKTLFKGVQVLRINNDATQSPLHAAQNTVTLEVPEEAANLLLLAAAKGEIILTYTERRDGQATVALTDADKATLEELLQLDPIPEPPAPPKLDPPQVTDIYRRSGRQTAYFRDGYPTNGPFPPGFNSAGYPSGYTGNGWGGGGWGGGGRGTVNPHPAWGFGDQNGNYFNPNSGSGYGTGNGPGRGSNVGPGPGGPGMPSSMNNPGFGAPYSGYGDYGPAYGAPGTWNPGPGVAPGRVSSSTQTRR